MAAWRCYQALFVISFLSFCCSVTLPGDHPLKHAVHHFETLHKDDVEHKVIRERMPRLRDNLREIHFTTHRRRFRLLLSPNSQHLQGYVQAHAVNSSGHTHRHPIQFDEFLRGHVFGERFSHVNAHVNEGGVVTAVIKLEHDTFFVEPSHRHIHESHDFHMIAYKASNLKMNLTGDDGSHYCGAPGANMSNDAFLSYEEHLHSHNYVTKKLNNHTSGVLSTDGRRLKRQSSGSGPTTVCRMNLVATHSFHEQFGGPSGSIGSSINYLILLIGEINEIFQATQFGLTGVTDAAPLGVRRLEIERIDVITQANGGPAYNDDDNVNSEDLLRIFALTNWEDYCLAHLFIGNSFSDSRLGVAYIASASSSVSGGICNRAATLNGLSFSGNTGVSSFRNSAGRLLLLAESMLVTAHELGHNWGSFHDPNTAECNPSQDNGGKFIMYEFAQDGTAPNNNVFSSCSILGISKVLNSLEDLCFAAPSDNMCGNYELEESAGEECDPGPTAVASGSDMCCSSECKLVGDAVCSDANHDCCLECHPKPSDAVCRTFAAENSRCFANNTCNDQITCPDDAVFLNVSSPCGTMGMCILDPDNPSLTICENFCEGKGLVTCHCTGEDECKLCCREGNNAGSCSIYSAASAMNLPDGSFCEGGTCQEGECIPSNPDLATFVFDIIVNLDVNAFLKLVEDNLVGTIIFLSLLIWIPVSTAVHCFDVWWSQKQKKEREPKYKSDDELTPLLQYVEESGSFPMPMKPDIRFNPDADLEKDKITKHLPS